MDTNNSKMLESHFGPESGLIDVSEFTRNAIDEQQTSTRGLDGRWSAISHERKAELANQCSTQDIKIALEQVWNDPTLSSFLLKEHDRVAAVLSSGSSKAGRPTRRAHFPAPDTLPPDLRVLHGNLSAIRLSSWTLPLNAGALMRNSKNSDQNAYDTLRFDESGQETTAKDENEAVIIVTVFDKVSWSPCYVSRLSQHAYLSSQTLLDICRTIPCSPYATQTTSSSSGAVKNYGIEDDSITHCIISIEGLVYGDSKDDDYAKKILNHISTLSKSKPRVQKAPTTLEQTTLASLSLRINEPYWMLHCGNCEHFIVVDQIRMLHPSDPRSGYPVTLQQTPRLLDICRACGKSPAVWSIVNDIRLGESPSFLCVPCWSEMGLPDERESDPIEVLPLLAYVP